MKCGGLTASCPKTNSEAMTRQLRVQAWLSLHIAWIFFLVTADPDIAASRNDVTDIVNQNNFFIGKFTTGD